MIGQKKDHFSMSIMDQMLGCLCGKVCIVLLMVIQDVIKSLYLLMKKTRQHSLDHM